MWATGTLSMLRLSFPPAHFRHNPHLLPARQHFSMSNLDGYGTCAFALQQNAGSRIVPSNFFPNDAGSDHLVNFGPLQPSFSAAHSAVFVGHCRRGWVCIVQTAPTRESCRRLLIQCVVVRRPAAFVSANSYCERRPYPID